MPTAGILVSNDNSQKNEISKPSILSTNFKCPWLATTAISSACLACLLHASGIYLEYTRTCLEWNEFHTNITVYLMFLEPRCMLRTNSKGATFSSRLQNSWSSVYYETAMDFFTGDTALVRCPDNFSFLSSIRRNNGSHAIIQCGVQTPGTWLPDFVTTLPSCVYVSLSRLLTNEVYRYCKAVIKLVDNLS